MSDLTAHPPRKSPPSASKSPHFRENLRLGAAGHGLRHWQMQRLTALALIPLVFWLVTVLVSASAQGIEAFVTTLRRPSISLGLMLFFAFAYYHAYLGVDTIRKDYVHHRKLRLMLEMASILVFGGFGVVSVAALIWLHFSH